jgi:hypothetical protein
MLTRGKIISRPEILVALYSWRDGTDLSNNDPFLHRDVFREMVSLVPGTGYCFTSLDRSIGDVGFLKEAAKKRPQLARVAGDYFPVLWDGSTSRFAIDLKSSNRNKVVLISLRSDDPCREVYSSVEELLADIIRANREDDSLSCLRQK